MPRSRQRGRNSSLPNRAWSERAALLVHVQFDGGTLALTVDVFKSVNAAKQGFKKVRDETTDRTRLYGDWPAGVPGRRPQARVAQGQLRAHGRPTALPDRFDRDAMVWATTLAVFDCW